MKVVNFEGNKVKEIILPRQFSEPYHPNLIKRAVWTIQNNDRHPYGSKERAGLRYSSTLSKRRKDYKGSYGKGLSRTPRKVMWRRGTQFGFMGATAPGTVGGRKAHPPKAEKVFIKKINKDIIIILGGPHVSSIPLKTFKEKNNFENVKTVLNCNQIL